MARVKFKPLEGWPAVVMASLYGVGGFLFFFLWVAGIVIAKGFFSTLFAIFFMPWGWYLVIEQLFVYTGFISPV